jgi:hypothetical protein
MLLGLISFGLFIVSQTVTQITNLDEWLLAFGRFFVDMQSHASAPFV